MSRQFLKIESEQGDIIRCSVDDVIAYVYDRASDQTVIATSTPAKYYAKGDVTSNLDRYFRSKGGSFASLSDL